MTQCTSFGWPAFLYFGTEIADGAIVKNTLRYGYRRLDSHGDFAHGTRNLRCAPRMPTAEQRAEAAQRAKLRIARRAYDLLVLRASRPASKRSKWRAGFSARHSR